MAGEQRLFAFDEAGEAVMDHRLEELALGAEVVDHQARAHPGAAGDVGDGGALVAHLSEHGEAGLEDLPGSGSRSSLPAASVGRLFGGTGIGHAGPLFIRSFNKHEDIPASYG